MHLHVSLYLHPNTDPKISPFIFIVVVAAVIIITIIIITIITIIIITIIIIIIIIIIISKIVNLLWHWFMLLQRQISTCQCRCSNHLSITFHCGHIAVSAYLQQTKVLNKQPQSRPCKQEHRCICSIPNHKYSKDVFHCVHMYARFAITDLIIFFIGKTNQNNVTWPGF